MYYNVDAATYAGEASQIVKKDEEAPTELTFGKKVTKTFNVEAEGSVVDSRTRTTASETKGVIPESDLTKGKISKHVKDKQVYIMIYPPEVTGGPHKVVRGYVVEDALLANDKSLAKGGDSIYLTQKLDFVPDRDLTTFFVGKALEGTTTGRKTTYPPGFKAALCSGTSIQYCTETRARAVWNEVKDKIGTGKKDYIIDPTSGFINSVRCVCLPGITSYLTLYRGMLGAVRNCFKTVLVTGDGSPGVCQAVLSTYICDLIYDIITCFTTKYGAGSGSTSTQEGGILGLGGILSSITSAGTSVSESVSGRYGDTSLYRALFTESKLVHSICLFAFTGTWDFDANALFSQGVGSVPIASQGFLFPCERRFISFDTSSAPPGLALWNYHFASGLVAGSDLSYTLSLECSADYSCDPRDGFREGACDCNTIGAQKLVVETGQLRQNDLLDKEIFRNIGGGRAPYRYNKAILEWQWRDQNNQPQTDKTECKISQKGGSPPAFCTFDALTAKFRCFADISYEFYAKFAREPIVNYPDARDDVFLVKDNLDFTVPILQRISEDGTCAAGYCEYTKFLIYTMRNQNGKVIASNDPSYWNREKTGARREKPPVEFGRDKILNYNGEETVILTPFKLPDADDQKWGDLLGTTKTTTKIAAGTDVAYSSDRYKVFVKDFTDTRKDVSQPLLIVIHKEKTFLAYPNKKVTDIKNVKPDSLSGGTSRRIGSDNKVTYGKVTITLDPKLFDVLDTTTPFLIYITKKATTTVTKKKTTTACSAFAGKPAKWTMTMEIRDAHPQAGAWQVSQTITRDLEGKLQQKKVTFEVVCNTKYTRPTSEEKKPEARICDENVLLRNPCHCYGTYKEYKDKVTSGAPFNWGPRREGVSGTQFLCIDGQRKVPNEITGKVCKTGDNDCLCGYDASGDPIPNCIKDKNSCTIVTIQDKKDTFAGNICTDVKKEETASIKDIEKYLHQLESPDKSLAKDAEKKLLAFFEKGDHSTRTNIIKSADEKLRKLLEVPHEADAEKAKRHATILLKAAIIYFKIDKSSGAEVILGILRSAKINANIAKGMESSFAPVLDEINLGIRLIEQRLELEKIQ